MTLLKQFSAPVFLMAMWFSVSPLVDFSFGQVSPIQRIDEAEQVGRDIAIRRRPVRIVMASGGNRLLIGNRSSGSISVVDTNTMLVVSEWKVASRIGDLVVWQDNRFLVTDQNNNGRLLCLQLTDDDRIQIDWSQETVGYPGKIAVLEDPSVCFVGGYWSRQVAKHDLEHSENDSANGKPASAIATIPFAAGEMLLIQKETTLLVSDAFGGHWASFDVADLASISNGDLGSRRICGLVSVPGDDDGPANVSMVTQPLNRLAQAIRNDVHWGLMVANELVVRDERSFVEADWKPPRRSPVPLGGPGEAKGDPESIVFSQEGEVAIAIGGVNQVAIGSIVERSFAYIATGARPVDACFSPDGKRLFVANHLDDSISVIDVRNYEASGTIQLGRKPESTIEDEGERLFFDATVSHDSWMSCHSCHVEGHTNGFLNDNFSDQSFGAPKRVLSLLGHGKTAPFAWNGSAKTLEDQIKNSIEITMQSDDSFSEDQINAMAAFITGLQAPPSLNLARGNQQLEKVSAGRALFEKIGCRECHGQQEYTIPQLRDVGLTDELGMKQFNPPSLIGVSQRQRFFHDARYSNMRELFLKNRHQLDRELTDDELEQLLAFLSSL